MSITIQHTDRQQKVTILGTLEHASECGQLLSLIKQATQDQVLELDFYDAELLPAEIIEAIAEQLNAGASIKLLVYRDLLAHTLARLSLPFRKVASQPLLSPLAECKALVLAGSANSLDKMQHIISCLPDADIVVFVAQHIGEDQANLLDKLFKVITNYRVVMPQNLMPVVAGTIYVAPPAPQLRVAHGLV